MNNTTHSVKAKEIERKWYVIDAADKPLGRVATEVARLLKGKHKPTYSTHMDCGDFVIVINSDKIVLTGNKLNDKYYRHHSGYMTGLKEISYKDLMAKSSDKALTLAVKGMLPKNSLGRSMITKLKIYKGSEHNNQAQKPEIWEF
ncbi:MAG: 50S ribosomal protein L13 [Clostridia bacterium]|jgi:ribosomal protein L13|nr:50S ribosomal protein L13 [Clostridia bacterium]CDC77646.1 50S ribosomal protein L13 [Clostridium sp. CAG:465]